MKQLIAAEMFYVLGEKPWGENHGVRKIPFSWGTLGLFQMLPSLAVLVLVEISDVSVTKGTQRLLAVPKAGREAVRCFLGACSGSQLCQLWSSTLCN